MRCLKVGVEALRSADSRPVRQQAGSGFQPLVSIVPVPAMASFVAWLGSFKDGKAKTAQHRTAYLFLNRAAQRHPKVQSAMREYETQQGLAMGCSDDLLGTGGQISALALIEPRQQHHALLPLVEEQQCQYDVFRFLAGEDLEGRLYYFRVVRVELLPVPLSVSAAAYQSRGRCLSFVRSEWAAHFFTRERLGVSQATMDWWKLQAGCRLPTVLFRTLKPFVLLTVARAWGILALPDFNVSGVSIKAGWSSYKASRRRNEHLQEDLLSLRDAFLATTSALSRRFIAAAVCPCPTLASSSGQQFVHSALCSVGKFLQGGRTVHDDLVQELYAASRIAQAAQDERVFWRFENEGLSSRSKHSVLRLLDFFFLAQYLRNDNDLRDALSLAASACMLPGEAQEIKRRLEQEDNAIRVPQASTISRARGRIDVAFMLFYRELLEHYLERGDRIYVQCDATWQAHREYQICLLNILGGRNLLELHEDCPHVLSAQLQYHAVEEDAGSCCWQRDVYTMRLFSLLPYWNL